MQIQKEPILFPSLQGNKLLISKLGLNQEIYVTLTDSLPWIQELLNELNSNMAQEIRDPLEKQGNLTLNLTFLKKWDEILQENLILSGSIEATYFTCCVRCLESMTLDLKISLSACFIPQVLMNEPEYQDQLTIYTQGQEFDLYFYPKKEVDLTEFLREQIYLNMDFIPLHEENCKGLCQNCGTNLNHQSCEHTAP